MKANSSKNYYHLIQIFLWFILSLACIHVVIILLNGVDALTYPYASTRTEAFVLNGALRIAYDESLYLGFTDMSYIIHVYNPLTYIPAGILGKAFDLDIESTLITGRFISFISTILLVSVLSYWVWLTTKSWQACALIATGLFFFQDYALTDFFRLRPESPGFLFTFTGFLIFVGDHKRKIAISSTLLFIAFLIKQSLIAAPVAILIYLLISKQNKDAIKFCITMTGMLSLFLVTMYFSTDGRYFQNTVIALAVNEVHPIENLFFYGPYLFEATFGLILAIPFVIFALLKMTDDKHIKGLLLSYFITSLILTFYMAGKTGAGDNYFSELTILSFMIVSYTVGTININNINDNGNGNDNNKPLILIAILLSLSTQVAVNLSTEGLLTPKMELQFEDTTSNLGPYVTRYNNIVGEKLILHEKIAIHTGKPVGFDWYLMEILENKGLIDLRPLAKNVANGKYSMIVFNQHPVSKVQEKIFVAVKNGPYKRTYVDNMVSEWSRIN